MTEVFGYLILAVLLGLATLFLKSAGRRNEAAWWRAASELGFGYSPAKPGQFATISGLAEGLRVEITEGEGRLSILGFKVHVDRCPWNLAIASKAGLPISGSVSASPVVVEDPAFEKIRVRGDEKEVFGLLDAETRKLVREFVELGGSLGWSDLTLRRVGGIGDPGEIVVPANMMIAVAKRLSRGPLPMLLLENVKTDPIPAIRVHNLRSLVASYGGSDECRRALQAGLEDRDPSVRLAAASLERGESGAAALKSLAADTGAPLELRASALEQLVSGFSYSSARECVVQALFAPESALNLIGIRAAGTAGDSGCLERICSLARSGDAGTAEAAAVALGKLGEPRAEGTLIGLLNHDEADVRVAAAVALGLLGTISAVEPMLAAADGPLGTEKLREVARDSIRRIQGRLHDADAGRLSLASIEGAAGAVSLATSGGEVSVADGEKPAPAALTKS